MAIRSPQTPEEWEQKILEHESAGKPIPKKWWSYANLEVPDYVLEGEGGDDAPVTGDGVIPGSMAMDIRMDQEAQSRSDSSMSDALARNRQEMMDVYGDIEGQKAAGGPMINELVPDAAGFSPGGPQTPMAQDLGLTPEQMQQLLAMLRMAP